jgi:hypothetical protein
MCQPPDLTGQIVRENIYYSALGGYGDIWMGTWNKGPERCTVRQRQVPCNDYAQDATGCREGPATK